MTATSNHPLPPKCKGQCVQSNVMMQVRANRAAAVRKQRYWSNRAAAVRYCGDLYHSNIVNGSEENYLQAN